VDSNWESSSRQGALLLFFSFLSSFSLVFSLDIIFSSFLFS
jgi:hypothetical protein